VDFFSFFARFLSLVFHVGEERQEKRGNMKKSGRWGRVGEWKNHGSRIRKNIWKREDTGGKKS